MKMNRTGFLRLIRISAIAVVVAAAVGYIAWRSLPYASGPDMQIFQPLSGSSVNAHTTDIVGRVSRVKSLRVNGSPISIDEEGNFKDTLAIFPGVNMIELEATDQFGRSIDRQLEILGL